ncbi:MAG TPA: hypothetical protein VJ894_02775, partial [Cryomorphaceae bacterium]|nr:hypothetical protein [Cryomorphaceae bacterium]
MKLPLRISVTTLTTANSSMLLKKITSTILSLICVSAGYAQVQIYEDYIGAGHSEDILISTSSSYSNPEWTD